MPHVELLECPALPAGYYFTLHLWQEGSHHKYRIIVTAPSSHRTVHSLERHSTRAATLEAATLATREHLERFTPLYPTSIRNQITTWLNTLTAPAENEQQLF